MSEALNSSLLHSLVFPVFMIYLFICQYLKKKNKEHPCSHRTAPLSHTSLITLGSERGASSWRAGWPPALRGGRVKEEALL